MATERFVRWQGRTIEQMGRVINLLIGIETAIVGFNISKLTEMEFYPSDEVKFDLKAGTIILVLSLILLLFTQYNRLLSFRITAQIAKMSAANETLDERERFQLERRRKDVKRIDNNTWRMLTFAIVILIIGVGLLSFGYLNYEKPVLRTYFE